MRSLLTWAAALPLATAASLQQITSFGPNPTNVSFYLYVPDSLIPSAPLLVFPHWCHGTAQDAFNNKPWRSLADTLGFVTIYPSTPWTADYCWDVSSPQTLSHDGGGDSLGIVSMVRWTLENYDVDPDRVFALGTSSGAMMTNVLVGAYPDVFAAGAAFAGVPFGCYAADGLSK
ncbi:Acetylxylan esterase A [Colletotrichum sp. SAR11_240]|nr:Acetylxylan esterase A [Colletotrichum sp. SAR11_240]